MKRLAAPSGFIEERIYEYTLALLQDWRKGQRAVPFLVGSLPLSAWMSYST